MSETSDSSQDRHLPASERKLQKAREQGDVARSRDLTSALGLAAAMLGLSVFGGSLLTQCLQSLSRGLRFDRTALDGLGPNLKHTSGSALQHQVFDWSVNLAWQALLSILPLLLLCAFGAIIGQLALGGIASSTQALKPDFSRMSPASGLGRIFSRHNLMEFTKLGVLVASLITAAFLYL